MWHSTVRVCESADYRDYTISPNVEQRKWLILVACEEVKRHRSNIEEQCGDYRHGVVKRRFEPAFDLGADVDEQPGISPIQGPLVSVASAASRVRCSSSYTNGVNDFLRLPARDTVTETACRFAISRPAARHRRRKFAEGKSRRPREESAFLSMKDRIV